MNRFYVKATNVLVESDALIEKFVGDEVTALFVPGFAGSDHAGRAVTAAKELLLTTGHNEPGGPWIPVGVGIHTGTAFVGSVGTADGVNEILALGDAVNTASRLTSAAGPGEIVLSEDTCQAISRDFSGFEERRLKLKGRQEPVDVRVLDITRM